MARLVWQCDARLLCFVLQEMATGPLALYILYDDVVLDLQRLAKFVENCADHEIRSLTLRIDAIRTYFFFPEHPANVWKKAEARLAPLRRLCLTRMKPTALSILVKFPFPYTALRDISSILDNLPASCISLEIDILYDETVAADLRTYSHLCDSIRAILPRLKHLHLRLPLICPAIFSESSGQDVHCQTVRAPMLKTCLINISVGPPGYVYGNAWASPCSNDQTPHNGLQGQLPSALLSILPVLKDFARLNSINLQRLWVIHV